MKRFGSVLNLIVILSIALGMTVSISPVKPASAQVVPPAPKLRAVVDGMLDALPESGTVLTQEMALRKIDPTLRDLAKAGGEELIDVMVSYRGAPDISQFLTGMIQRPEIFPGLKYMFGQATADNLLKVAFQVDVVSVVDNRLQDRTPPLDADSSTAPDPAAALERLQYLQANELTYQEAQAKINGDVTGSGWFDVLDGHKSAKAWEKGFRGQGVIVGVVDAGVDFAHPD